ncbi:MAG: hypothetical protein BV458_08030 [Thermoplasmata archaeon M9B2D]|nr:MAG: hypothetical protein BV458_08030 [Thermoplasmata archaeon M9B2D]
MYFFFIAFAVLGAGLKYIDDAFDEKVFNKKTAYVIAPLLGVLWAYTMIIDAVAATILLAILLGVLVKGKIDNIAHVIGLVVIIAIVVAAGVQLLFVPLIILAVAALLDEVGNDVVDKSRYLAGGKWWQRIIIGFFDQRWVAKVAILGLVAVSVLPWFFFVAMLLFDGAYLGVRSLSEVRQKALYVTPPASDISQA